MCVNKETHILLQQSAAIHDTLLEGWYRKLQKPDANQHCDAPLNTDTTSTSSKFYDHRVILWSKFGDQNLVSVYSHRWGILVTTCPNGLFYFCYIHSSLLSRLPCPSASSHLLLLSYSQKFSILFQRATYYTLTCGTWPFLGVAFLVASLLLLLLKGPGKIVHNPGLLVLRWQLPDFKLVLFALHLTHSPLSFISLSPVQPVSALYGSSFAAEFSGTQSWTISMNGYCVARFLSPIDQSFFWSQNVFSCHPCHVRWAILAFPIMPIASEQTIFTANIMLAIETFFQTPNRRICSVMVSWVRLAKDTR